MNPPEENAPPADRRTVDPKTGRPLPTREHPGYYPGYSTLGQQGAWDPATRTKVLQRVHDIPPIRFFTPDEAALMQAIIDHVLPQDDRTASTRIPILPRIDERLHAGRIHGYRFENMPPDGEAHRMGLQAIDRMAQAAHEKPFLQLLWRQQENLLKSIHDAKPMPGAEDIWQKMPVHRYWALLVQDCVAVYYSHPWAWDEIGFGGPAYPRAYFRLERGEPEPWEVEEKRYEWKAPPDAMSDPDEKEIAAHSHKPVQGQGGTH